MGASDFGQRSS
uniref:Uncharacterized protein n=1 Tax=Rhizophora mucronata TaxID=61149 RepID=A0A2P2J2A2_RHIMU